VTVGPAEMLEPRLQQFCVRPLDAPTVRVSSAIAIPKIAREKRGRIRRKGFMGQGYLEGSPVSIRGSAPRGLPPSGFQRPASRGSLNPSPKEG